MRGKDLLECMEYIDDVLIEEALNPVIVPRWNANDIVIKWSMAAACVIVIGISATVFLSHQNIEEEYSGSNNSGIETQMANDCSVDDDAAALADNGGSQTTGALASSIQKNEMAKEEMRNTEDNAGKSITEDNVVEDEVTLLLQESADISDLTEQKAAGQEPAKQSYTVISDYAAKDGEYSYAAPEKGKSFCHQQLKDAIAYYDSLEKESDSDSPLYAYAVVIDVFGDIETEEGIYYEQLNRTDTGNELIEQEYRRLIELGYSVRLSEDFQFTGTFTKEEIDNFDASPEYGYAFRFENEN